MVVLQETLQVDVVVYMKIQEIMVLTHHFLELQQLAAEVVEQEDQEVHLIQVYQVDQVVEEQDIHHQPQEEQEILHQQALLKEILVEQETQIQVHLLVEVEVVHQL